MESEKKQAAPAKNPTLDDQILRDQQLVNERDEPPAESGGMPVHPVEGAASATPSSKRETTPVETIESNREKRNIQSDGS